MSRRKPMSAAAVALGLAVLAAPGVAHADQTEPETATTSADSAKRPAPPPTTERDELQSPAPREPQRRAAPVPSAGRVNSSRNTSPAGPAPAPAARHTSPTTEVATTGIRSRALPLLMPDSDTPASATAAPSPRDTVTDLPDAPPTVSAQRVEPDTAILGSVVSLPGRTPAAPANSPVSWVMLAAARRQTRDSQERAAAQTVSTQLVAGSAAAVLTAADRAFWTAQRGIGFSVGSQGALIDQTRLETALNQVNALGFTTIRTWGTDAYTGRILEAITRLNLPITVQAGVYITKATEANSQIDSALAVLKPYSDRVIGVSLGNEQLVDWNTSATLTVQNVIDQVNYFKSKSTLPVTYNFAGETFLPNASQWNQNLAGLLSRLDYINVHSYAGFFDNRNNPAWTPARQLEVLKSYEAMLSTKLNSLGLGSKPIILGETGWQSTGYNAAVTNAANMQQYYENVTRYVYGPDARFDGMYYFNFTDEAWKGGDNYWGLYGEGSRSAIGTSKFAVAPVGQIIGTVAGPQALQTVKTNGAVSLLKDPATGIAYIQSGTAPALQITRADSYWTGAVPLTRNGATLISAALDSTGKLRVLDTSSYGNYGWVLDTTGKFTGEQKYDPTTLTGAETLFAVDLNNDGRMGTLTGGSTQTAGNTTTSPATVTAGSFPVALVNKTGGAWRDDQIFVTILGQTTPGQWAWVDATGNARPLDPAAASAPDRLVKSGVGYANMAFTLAQSANLRIPPQLEGGRMFISVGQPLYIAISPDGKGWAGPNPTYTGDPNYNTVFDWYEFTYSNNRIPFGGNTTQVDQFGLPLTATVEQTSSGYATTRGLTVSRAQLLAAFAQKMPAAFQPLLVKDTAGAPLRIVAPRTSAAGVLAAYLDPAVNDFWAKYKTQTFTFSGGGYSVTGRIDANDQFAYTLTSGGATTSYTMRKPTSAEIFACAGPFSGPGFQGAFLAELSAAFNRGVADNPQAWGDPAAYYPAGKRWNAFAKLFHDYGVDKYAYGFPYDDVTSQSSVQILGNAAPPSKLTIAVGW